MKRAATRAALFICCLKKSLSRDAYFRRCRLYVRSDVLFELGKVLLEHCHQIARSPVELCLVLPGLEWIEQMRLYTLHRGRHGETEVRIGAEVSILKRSIESSGQQRAGRLDRHAAAFAVLAAGPARIDQPAVDLMPGDVVAQQVGIDRW